MKLDEQCCTLEQAKELRGLGVEQNSLFYHSKYKGSYSPKFYPNRGNQTPLIELKETYSAFTVAELSVMLGDHYPSWSFKYKNKTKWIATIITKDVHKDGRTVTTEGSFDRYDKTQAQALAELLIATIKVGHIQVSTINKRLK